jgi:hypothetical protein
MRGSRRSERVRRARRVGAGGAVGGAVCSGRVTVADSVTASEYPATV